MSENLRPQPYLGISGAASIEDHSSIIEMALDEQLLNGDHFVMVGIQATSKTQILHTRNKRGPFWHPIGEAIRYAAGNDDSGLTKPYIHCFFETDEDLDRGLALVMNRTIRYAQGVQLNMLPWMEKDYRPFLENFRTTWPNIAVVLQANKPILDAYTPSDVAKRLEQLPVDYVLFDASHGFAKELDVARTRPFVDAVYQTSDRLGVAVAGGLSHESVERLLLPLLTDYPDLSCDAEGKLRTGEEGWTHLDITKTRTYMRTWKQLQERLKD